MTIRLKNHEESPMQLAIKQAETAKERDEIPVGAVIVDSVTGRIISSRHNQVEVGKDPTAHAEMLAIREACGQLASSRLPACDMYVTLEPCPMCAQAIALARIRRLYFGAYDPKGGGVENGPRIFSQSTCHHRPEIIGGMEEKICSDMLKQFFATKR